MYTSTQQTCLKIGRLWKNAHYEDEKGEDEVLMVLLQKDHSSLRFQILSLPSLKTRLTISCCTDAISYCHGLTSVNIAMCTVFLWYLQVARIRTIAPSNSAQSLQHSSTLVGRRSYHFLPYGLDFGERGLRA